MSRRSLRHHPDFVRLWVGETVSIFGTLIGRIALQFTAIIWLDANAFQVAVLAACGLVPGFLAGLVAGVWVDRLARRPIMIAADLCRAAILLTVPLAAWLDVLTIQQLWSVAFTTAALTVFFDVAYEAYLPTLVEPGELVEGNSKLQASASVAEFGSFGVSGWLVQLLRGPGAVLVDAASFVVSALAIWRIRTPELPRESDGQPEHLAREALEGVRAVVSSPVIRSLALANLLVAAGGQIISVVYLLYLNRELGFSPGVLGMIFGIGGLTSLAGAAVAARRSTERRFGPGLVAAAFLRAVGMLFMPLTGSVSALGVSSLVTNQLVTDPAWTYYEINAVSLRQAITPNRLLGRVNATVRFGEFGAQLAGVALGGFLGAWLGYREALFVAAGFAFLGALALFAGPIPRLSSLRDAVPATAVLAP